MLIGSLLYRNSFLGIMLYIVGRIVFIHLLEACGVGPGEGRCHGQLGVEGQSGIGTSLGERPGCLDATVCFIDTDHSGISGCSTIPVAGLRCTYVDWGKRGKLKEWATYGQMAFCCTFLTQVRSFGHIRQFQNPITNLSPLPSHVLLTGRHCNSVTETLIEGRGSVSNKRL